MTYPTRSSANRFAHNADPSNDYNSVEHFYDAKTQHSITPLEEQMTEFSSYHSQPIAASDAQAPLRVHVERVVREYFATLGDELPTDLYDLILREVELPLLTVTLEQTRGNQTKCAHILGLNRGTLRKKLKTYHLMS